MNFPVRSHYFFFVAALLTLSKNFLRAFFDEWFVFWLKGSVLICVIAEQFEVKFASYITASLQHNEVLVI